MSRPVDKSNKPVIRTADAHRRAACALVAATAIVVSLAWFFFLVEYHDAAQIRIQEAAQNVAAAVAAVAQRCPSPTEPGSSVIASVDEAGKLSCGIVE
ncbi:MAG: hypothetical protein KKH53_02605, partial [Gammaproteobacteria bacterium]|nr:hypothetical protein [Gammaproteobacteria bacterium]